MATNIPICYDDDEDNTIAITPVLPIEEPDNSPNYGGLALNTIPETESDEFIKSSVEDLVPIPKEIGSGSPITHSELSLPDFKAFYIDNDHFKERSSGSTTTHVDFSQYDSFIFDLSNDQFPPTDRSDLNHEKFADELAHIISPPEYDHFCFKIEPELGNLTMDVVNDIFPTREPRVHVPNSDDDFIFHLLPHGPMNSGSSRACDSVNKNKALRGRHPMLIRSMYSRIVKALDSVIFNSSFTSSASIWEFRTDNQEKDEKQSQNDKTGLGMEKL
ncbi:hypothetical protein Tco_1577925 [Tanacetum coccineum]